jgi:hypothetical protein
MTNWKPIKGYEGIYEVSDDGHVKSLPRPRAKGGILKTNELNAAPLIWERRNDLRPYRDYARGN